MTDYHCPTCGTELDTHVEQVGLVAHGPVVESTWYACPQCGYESETPYDLPPQRGQRDGLLSLSLFSHI